jgi:hypothetical protein
MNEGKQLRMLARQVTQLRFDHAVTIHLWQGDGEVTIRISSRFAVEYGGTTFEVDPDAGDHLGAALPLLHADGAEARVTPEGGLEMRFDGGLRLTVAPDARFEAWQVDDSQGACVISTPGGELSVRGEPWAS